MFITSVIQAMQRIFNRTAVVGFVRILQISHKFGGILEIAVRLQKKKRREKPFPVYHAVKANQEERKEAFPPEDGDAVSHDFGLSISAKILSHHLGCTWKKIFADEDALYLLECSDR